MQFGVRFIIISALPCLTIAQPMCALRIQSSTPFHGSQHKLNIFTSIYSKIMPKDA